MKKTKGGGRGKGGMTTLSRTQTLSKPYPRKLFMFHSLFIELNREEGLNQNSLELSQPQKVNSIKNRFLSSFSFLNESQNNPLASSQFLNPNLFWALLYQAAKTQEEDTA